MKGLSCHVEEFGFYYRNNVVVVQSLSHVQLFDHGLQHTRLPCPSLSQPTGSSRGCSEHGAVSGEV